MLNKQNLHTHSTFSDGKDTPEQIILEAINRGFNSIGFSDHSYMYFTSSTTTLTPAAEDYKAEILRLKRKYKGQIDVLCGMEFEFYSEVPLNGYDYLIGSIHYLDFDGTVLGFDNGLNETVDFINRRFNGNGLAFAKRYFETVSRLPERGNFDILGHFDLLVKNNELGCFIDETSKDYLTLGYDAIHALKGKIPLFEVNTGAIARGHKSTPYPILPFLKEFKKCGFGAVVSSDCHNKSFIDCNFDEAENLLSAAGFNTKWILTDDGFKEVAL